MFYLKVSIVPVLFMAGPLFNDMEIKRNQDLAARIEKVGVQVFLPQSDVGVFYDGDTIENVSQARTKIFQGDVAGIKSCDIFLILLDGRVPDEGACVELGIAWSIGKTCVGLKTDLRAMDNLGNDNIMIEKSLSEIFDTEDKLLSYLTVS